MQVATDNTSRLDHEAREPNQAGAKSRHGPVRSLTIALIVVVAAAAAGILFVLQSTVPKSDLEAAQAQLVATEAELEETTATLVEAERQVVEGNETTTSLQAEIADLQQDVATLEATVVRRDADLADFETETGRLTADVAAAQDRAAAARATLDAATEDVQSLAALVELHVAWELWWNANADLFRELDRLDVDLSTMDALVSGHGLAGTWEEWAVDTNFLRAAREMEDAIGRLDTAEVEEAFDLWYACMSEEECLVADVAVIGALQTARSDLIERIAATLGVTTGPRI